MSGSRYAKLPAAKVIILPSSNLSPIPTLKLPETTVTFSRVGCQWGAILYPFCIFSRIVKSPALAVGSPSRTANCAPDATNGGAGPHLICSGVKAFWGVTDCPSRTTPQNRKKTTSIFFMERFLLKERFIWNALTYTRCSGAELHVPAGRKVRVTSVPARLLAKFFKNFLASV